MRSLYNVHVSVQRGVTLIELMIVVVIIAILASVAVPSYQRYQQDARRADVQAIMVEYAQRLERNFSVNNSYLRPGGVSPDLPAATNAYTFAFNGAPTATVFSVVARPTALQLNDRCGALILDNRGNRTARVMQADGTLGDPIANCWQ